MEKAQIIWILLVLSYFIPSLIATMRKCRRSGMIFMVNLIFGWTVLGWIVALIWGICGNNNKFEQGGNTVIEKSLDQIVKSESIQTKHKKVLDELNEIREKNENK